MTTYGFFLKPELPCIKNKCLVFPACRNKELLYCTELKEYCENVTRFESEQLVVDELVGSTFPYMLGLMIDKLEWDKRVKILRSQQTEILRDKFK